MEETWYLIYKYDYLDWKSGTQAEMLKHKKELELSEENNPSLDCCFMCKKSEFVSLLSRMMR